MSESKIGRLPPFGTMQGATLDRSCQEWEACHEVSSACGGVNGQVILYRANGVIVQGLQYSVTVCSVIAAASKKLAYWVIRE